MFELKFRAWIKSKKPWMAKVVKIDLDSKSFIVEKTGQILNQEVPEYCPNCTSDEIIRTEDIQID